MAKKYFLPKMAIMKMSASFPQWDGRHGIIRPEETSKRLVS